MPAPASTSRSPADYDGDGITDIATFRADSDVTPGAADWFVLPSSGGSAYRVSFGAGSGVDQPVPADYDGDGMADIATFRADSDLEAGRSAWFLKLSGGPSRALTLGDAGSLAAPADYDGDGRIDLATFDLALATWRIQSLDATSEEEIVLGRDTSDEVPVAAPLADRLLAAGPRQQSREMTSIVAEAGGSDHKDGRSDGHADEV